MRPRSLRARFSARDVAAAGTGRNSVVLVFERLVVTEQTTTLPVRVPWNGFPDVMVHSSISKLKSLPDYYAAKWGDHQAASRIAHALVREVKTNVAVDYVVPVIQVDRGDTTRFQWRLAQYWPNTLEPGSGWMCTKSTRWTTRTPARRTGCKVSRSSEEARRMANA